MDHIFFFKGIILGFIIAAPLGPIGILCARRTLTHGRRAGFASGMGAASADAVYGFVAAFGMTFVSDVVTGNQYWLRLVGGALLCFMGVRTYVAQPEKKSPAKLSMNRYAGMFTSTFFLTLTNPMTIFSLAAVFAGFGVAGTRGSMLSAAILILGVFLGSALWWLFLVGLFTVFKRRLDHDQMRWINRVAGVIIGGSGVLALLTLAG